VALLKNKILNTVSGLLASDVTVDSNTVEQVDDFV